MVWTRTLQFRPGVGRVVGRLLMKVRLRMGRKLLGTVVSVPPRRLMTKLLRRFRLAARSASVRLGQKRPRAAPDLDLDLDPKGLDRGRPDVLGPGQATGPDQTLAPGLTDLSQALDLDPDLDLGTAGGAPLGPGALVWVCICGGRRRGGRDRTDGVASAAPAAGISAAEAAAAAAVAAAVAAVAMADTWLWAP